MLPVIKMPVEAGGGITLPNTRASTKFWLNNDPLTMWRDVARTTPAIAGQPVQSWKEQIGNFYYECVADSVAPALNATSNALVFNGTSSRLSTVKANVAWMVGAGVNFRIYAVTAPTSVTGNRCIICTGYNALGWALQFYGSKLSAWIGNGAGTYVIKDSTANAVTGMQLSELVWDNTGNLVSPVINNGVKTDTAAFASNLGTHGADNLSFIGGTATGSTNALAWAFAGPMSEIVIVQDQSAEDHLANLQYLQSKYSITLGV